MNLFQEYLDEITTRKKQGLSAKPIDNGDLACEIIAHIKSIDSEYHDQCVDFLIFNMLPGTTKAANEKAEFLKQIINDNYQIDEISIDRAFELLSHMKGGPSIKVLIDLALGQDGENSKKAAEVLKTQVFLYEADTARLISAYRDNNSAAEDILKSYSKAEFFTKLPEIEDEIEIVTYVAGEGDISTDLLSPGNQAHSRADRELHGKCFISERAQKEIEELKLKHPDRRIMLVAEKRYYGRWILKNVLE
jgi:Aconitase B